MRQGDGGLKAFVNICSHRGAPLNECDHGKAKKGRLFACPYHGWTYDLEGKLIGVPFGKEGFDGIDRDTLGLRPLDVQEKHGMIFVMPNPDKTLRHRRGTRRHPGAPVRLWFRGPLLPRRQAGLHRFQLEAQHGHLP